MKKCLTLLCLCFCASIAVAQQYYDNQTLSTSGTSLTLPTGTLTTDSVKWSFNAVPGTGYTAGLQVLNYVTVNAVNFLVCNPTAGSLTPAAATLNWEVIR